MDRNKYSDIYSVTSPDTVEPGLQKYLYENKNQIQTVIFVLTFFRILITVMFIYIISTSEKYETLYESETNAAFVSLNLFISYILIGIAIFLFVYYNKQICHIIKNVPLVKPFYIILLFIFIVFIISTLRLTYILINFDEYRNKDLCFLTYYYTLMQFLSILVTFTYFI